MGLYLTESHKIVALSQTEPDLINNASLRKKEHEVNSYYSECLTAIALWQTQLD